MRKRRVGNKPKTVLESIWVVFVWIVFALLLVATIGVAALRIGNVLPDGVDILFIVGKDPSYKVEDGESKTEWEEKTTVSIFQSSYQNGENVTTVLSQNGDDVIAPGAVSTYRFCVYNDGNMAIAYELDFGFLLAVNGVEFEAGIFPLYIRLIDTVGNYVVGSETTWQPITSTKAGHFAGTLGLNSYEEFTLELKWAFDGNDELDTLLGNLAEKAPVSLAFTIDSLAELHAEPDAEGGVEVLDGSLGEMVTEVGGEMRWAWFILLLLTLIGVLLYLLYLL